MKRSTQQPSAKRERRVFASFSVAARARIASLLVIVGVLFGFGLRVSHMLLVQHVVCAHGHLVDERRTSANAEKNEEKKVRDPGANHVAEADDAGNGDEHEHCDAMSLVHRDSGFSLAPCVTTLSWLELAGIKEARESHPIEIIALAPKSSPPGI